MEVDENIKNLLPPRPVIFKKEKRHVSEHHEKVRAEYRAYQASHATMGFARTPLDPPSNYMKTRYRDNIEKIVKESNKAKAAAAQHLDCNKKPALPKPLLYPPPDRDKGGVNWVATNVQHVRSLSPRRPSPKFVDVPGGDTQELLPSGLYPQYVFKKNFGRVPTYLQRRQAQLRIEKEIEEQEEALRSSRSEKGTRQRDDFSLLTEDERKEMLKGLQTNLREAQRQLQTLPVVCETNEKKKKRDTLEQKVSDLGRYIFLLENYKVAIRE